jgi:hypothetical protein
MLVGVKKSILEGKTMVRAGGDIKAVGVISARGSSTPSPQGHTFACPMFHGINSLRGAFHAIWPLSHINHESQEREE